MKRYLTFKNLLPLLFIASMLSAQKMEIRALNEGATSVKGIANNGDAVLLKSTYKYDTNTITPKESTISFYAGMNSQGDILAFGSIDGSKDQPVYKKAGTSVWLGTGYFADYTGTNATPYFISNNGKYITGQMNSMPFFYDTESKQITNLKPAEYKYGAGYGVNNEGVTVGWLDKAVGTTFRQLAIMQVGKSPEIILSDRAVPIINQISYIDDNGMAIGDVASKPFYYNTKTKEYKIFDLPTGFNQGTFTYTVNGIFIGYVQNSPIDRDAVIYHPSLGDKPKLIRDILTEQGVDNPIPGKKLGTAFVMSPNGDFIGGMEQGSGNIAPGWIIKLNGLFNPKECHITAPVDVEVLAKNGETTAVANYDVSSDCPENKLVLAEGLASGSQFPIGETKIVYNLVNSKDEIITSKTFKVYVRDYFCTMAYNGLIEPITRVKIGDLDNRSSASTTTSAPNEYFFGKTTDLKKGEKYDITVEGNTNGPDMDQVAVYFDWDQSYSYNPDVEGYFVGKITNSTGEDGQSAVMSIPIPLTAKEGKIRMRVIKIYRLEPSDPCATFYGYGQTENYIVNITKENLGTNEVDQKQISISPNPVKDVLTLQGVKAEKMEIYNLAGQQVKTVKLNNNTANVAELPKGVYLIKTIENGKIQTTKFIKQ